MNQWIAQVADDQERLSMAESELKEMTPEKLLAIYALVTKLEDQLKMPEAGGSASTYLAGPGGAEILAVSRGVSIEIAFADLEGFIKTRLSQGYTPVIKYPNKARSEPVTERPAQAVQAPAEGAPATAPATAAKGTGAIPAHDGEFEVGAVSVSVNDGKTSFRIKGGPFTTYGVICWPEVLVSAGFDPANPPKALNGWKAYYVNNPETGKPKKVVALAPAF